MRKLLLSNFENCEHVKYFGNVYCVMTNHIGDQDMRANHKLITIAAYSLVISHRIGFFLSTQTHYRNISGVHSFMSFTVNYASFTYRINPISLS